MPSKSLSKPSGISVQGIIFSVSRNDRAGFLVTQTQY